MVEDDAPASDLRVVDNPERGRFEGYLGETLAGVVEYRQRPEELVATHVEVLREHEGKGVATRLVGALVDQLRADGRTLRSRCPYVDDWLRRHPEAADVTGRGAPG